MVRLAAAFAVQGKAVLTLDTLARMADRAPSELRGGGPPYRRPAARAPVLVRLPTITEERRRALALLRVVLGGVAVLTIGGVIATHGAQLAEGTLALSRVARTTAWLVGWSAALLVPFAAIGLARELARYRRARARIGATAWLGADGTLASADGTTRVRLTAARRG